MGISVSASSGGASRTRALASSRLMDVDERLPTKYPTLYVAMGAPRGVGWFGRDDRSDPSYSRRIRQNPRLASGTSEAHTFPPLVPRLRADPALFFARLAICRG